MFSIHHSLLVGAIRRLTSRLPVGRGWGKFPALVAQMFDAQPQTYLETMLGSTMRLRLDLGDFQQRFAFFSPQLYEYRVANAIRASLQPGGTFVDIGANVGLFTLLASELTGDTGRVVSIEPDPGTFAALQSNVALNNKKNVTLVNMAVSNIRGQVSLHRDLSGDSGKNTLAANAESGSGVLVTTSTLDDLLDRYHVEHVDVVKIDIEGWEVRPCEDRESCNNNRDP